MRLLVVGDFHGHLPKKFERIVKDEKIDLVVSTGDYLPFKYRKLWFKHCFRKNVELWNIIGKSKYKKLIENDLLKGENALKALNGLGVPVVTVLGNIDYPSANDVMDERKPRGKNYWKFEYSREDAFINLLKKYKNIFRIDYSYFRYGNFVFIGARGHSNKGRVKSKAFRKHKIILGKIFKKFNKENMEGKVIFVSHNVPYDTHLDLVSSLKAHALVKGKHVGSKLVRRVINKFHPILHFGGHVHESRGMQKIGKTLCINSGAVHDGQGAIVYLENGKVKVRFVR